MPSAATALDTASWPTQTEAAVLLATNERTIRRWIESGKLRAAFRPAPGRKPVAIVDPAGVERLRAERQTTVLVTAPAVAESNYERSAVTASALARQSDAPEALAIAGVFRALLTNAAAAAPKPWLSTGEAAEYSGLPRAWLLAQARAGLIRAVNVGARERWRFSRKALDG